MKLSIALIGFSLCCVIPLKAQEGPVIFNTQSTIECNEVPLEIRSFKDAVESEKFKIVANRPVTYSAIGGLSYDPYVWILSKSTTTPEFNYFFTLQGITPSVMAHIGTARIDPNTLRQFNSNQYFGEATVQVDNATGGMVEKEVKIFYEKEAIHPVSGNPNWLDYWADNPIIKNLFGSIQTIKSFNKNTCMFENSSIMKASVELVYGPTYDYDPISLKGRFGSLDWARPFTYIGKGTGWCEHLYNERIKVNKEPIGYIIILGPGASKRKNAWERPDDIVEGIHCFYSTIAHEVEHAIIMYDNWKDGYENSKDVDNDNYHDDWEGIANSEMTESDFSPKPKGRFSDELGIDSYHRYHPDDLFQDPPRVSAGTDYEEWRCRKKEYDLFSQLNEIDEYDWSYDPPVENNDDPRLRTQGKQWKN